MATVDKEVIVNAPIEKIFSYISDPSNWPEFWPSLMKIEDVQSLPKGGYSAKYEYKMAGVRFKGTGQYTEFVPNNWIVVQTKGGIQSTITCTFRSIEGKTRVTLTIEYKVPILLLGKLAEFVILKMNDREADLVMFNLQIRFMMASH
ncbi:SRPBCC family protein [Chloroflexota bacterium]